MVNNLDKSKEDLLIELEFLQKEFNELRKSYEKIQHEAKSDVDMKLKLLKAINTTSDAIFLTNTDGIITYINSGFEALYGFTFEETVNKVTARIIKSGLLKEEVYEHFWDTLLKKNEVKGEILNRRKNGDLVYVEGTASPILDENNVIIGYLGIQRDNTERKRFEKELKTSKEKAEENDHLKTAFLQNLSHEIRTPMNAIIGFSDLLAMECEDNPKLEKYSKIIQQRCSDLLEIINDILDISKIESGQLTITLEKCNLNVLFSEIESFFHEQQVRLNKQNIVFNLQACGGSSPVQFITDKIKLKQIFINLISNAFKFTTEGKIEGGCNFDENHNVIFYIKDTGIGIPSDKHDSIFERFTQLENQTKYSTGGTGLGLSIVRGLVNLMGGKIWLDSIPDKGSTFYFSFPHNNNQSV